MTILLIGSVLLGVALGRFFKVLVLIPASAFVLGAVLGGSAHGEHGLLRPLLEFAVLNTTLQIGYVLGNCIPRESQHQGKLARVRPLPRR
ncbi:MAG: hypothetical protein ACRED2_12080 [Methylocella sp.]